MKNASLRPLLALCLVALPLFAAAASAASAPTPAPAPGPTAISSDLSPQAEANALEGDLGFGYAVNDGSAALAVDTSAVFCPDVATLVIDPGDATAVKDQFKAADNGDGTWTLADPETSASVTARVQSATSTYTDDTTVKPARSTLPVVSSAAISIAPIRWNRCWRIRRGHACGIQAACPGGCNNGYRYVGLKKFLVCKYTGSPFDLCLDSLQPVCRLDRYTCRDCTGPLLASWLNFRYVCATF